MSFLDACIYVVVKMKKGRFWRKGKGDGENARKSSRFALKPGRMRERDARKVNKNRYMSDF